MSNSIDIAFVNQYQDMFHTTASQRVSRLESFTRRKPGNVVGESFSVDILGTTEADFNRSRHADLTYANLQNSRRFADMVDLTKAELIDSMDKIKLLIEPTNAYNQELISAINRGKDKTIINALGGAVRTTSGTSALPSGQKITAGGTGLTLAKLRQAKVLLDDAEMDDSDWFVRTGNHMNKQDEWGNLSQPAYVLACTTKQIDNLLADSTVTNSDYNSVKALVAGTINTFMGFYFVRLPSSQMPLSGSDTLVYAYAPKAIEYGIGMDVNSSIERIPQKDAWQVLAKASVGAARAEDAGVVEIACV